MPEPKITDFQQRVLDLMPKFPGQISVRKLVTKVYDHQGYPGWKKFRGQTTAVSKALWKLQKMGLVGWPNRPYDVDSFRKLYWQKS